MSVIHCDFKQGTPFTPNVEADVIYLDNLETWCIEPKVGSLPPLDKLNVRERCRVARFYAKAFLQLIGSDYNNVYEDEKKIILATDQRNIFYHIPVKVNTFRSWFLRYRVKSLIRVGCSPIEIANQLLKLYGIGSVILLVNKKYIVFDLEGNVVCYDFN